MIGSCPKVFSGSGNICFFRFIARSLTLHDHLRYFTSFMDDPLFEKTEGTGPYSEAQVILFLETFETFSLGLLQAAYQAGDYDNIIPLCEKEVTEGGPNKVRYVLLILLLRHLSYFHTELDC